MEFQSVDVLRKVHPLVTTHAHRSEVISHHDALDIKMRPLNSDNH